MVSEEEKYSLKDYKEAQKQLNDSPKILKMYVRFLENELTKAKIKLAMKGDFF